MVFSSMVFLWVFLPAVLIIYYFIDKKYKNLVLLISSLIFYSFGEPKYILLMVLSIIINYIFGILVDREENLLKRKLILALSVFINLAILGYFKYFNFFTESLNKLFNSEIIALKEIILPIGISFYTFQALSYVVDVYRGKGVEGGTKVQKNIFDLALYISFFPQLIAGPIVKYYDIEAQLRNRDESLTRITYGIKRFIFGLSKKVLISNVMASTADSIFKLPIDGVGTPLAWLGLITYTLQIYYDFSGYSDMAIGLGEIFGFTFMENFNYPYISKSIKEFWRRWHISLSTWFKEYLYIPLGGNRKGKYRTYVNLFIVFLATGLWHGASFNFILWGMIHGFFIVIERMFLGKILDKNKFKLLNHIYTLFVVMIAWVFFRVEGFREALRYIKALFVYRQGSLINNIDLYLNKEVILIVIIGILFSGIIQMLFKGLTKKIYLRDGIKVYEVFILIILLFLCIVSIVSGTYNPFIYFRF
ncbi:MBOAT family O-acyltransferase [Clostridium tertium]|uniref:MBOAT family O-acyltransferase n=1 Tax=Clostridium tertium TaxID=1559 RepID=UPI0024B3A328|nr:MBOAT family protein [Clostridium tertium]MDI9216992.1 MBOAT family protein [Clostridium tertium]